MTPPLFLVDELPPGDVVVLDGAEGRHAARVKRIAVGETVLVGDGRGTVAECVVDSVGTDALSLRVTARRTVPEPDPRIVVVQALPKGDRAELAVELLTEVGVDEIVPWAARRSIVQWTGERGVKARAKWQRTAAEAAKQSRRTRVPHVAEPVGLADVTARTGTVLVLHEAATEPLSTTALPGTGEIVLVVGPEGGVSDEELAALTAAGARPVRLGEMVLRTSTAGAAAVAALSVRVGRW
ncbi:MAG TPA: 16S rRNA (uracil(1498)-N(3))-methyltransferase [Jatrophihabitantaceae bacterium]